MHTQAPPQKSPTASPPSPEAPPGLLPARGDSREAAGSCPGVPGSRFPARRHVTRQRGAKRGVALRLRPVPAARGAPEARGPAEAPPPFPQRSARAFPPRRAPGREPAATPVSPHTGADPVPSRCGLPGLFSPSRCPPPSSSSHGRRASHRLRAGRPRWRLRPP
ncbi:nascent polypeptide-associated complex subunit alpha, muscle-specific form-like [Cygnus atratus]|uniref:nascent polypeptide-associated complex subunit alpha, muscle-specific form-like n=1 Tax=Cygnus atratus TaxID=8868 RepID=UPI0021B7847B|nr:nascent polypeptide-associated complex subunit alpha, muscle-specific form-like [Cygnus atratus]